MPGGVAGVQPIMAAPYADFPVDLPEPSVQCLGLAEEAGHVGRYLALGSRHKGTRILPAPPFLGNACSSFVT